MKKILITVMALGFGLASIAQTIGTPGVGVQYNNFGGDYFLPVWSGGNAYNARGVLRLTHKGHSIGSFSDYALPDYHSPENLVLDWGPGLETTHRYSRTLFRDGDMLSTQATLVSYGEQYSITDHQNDIGFHSYVNENGGQHFFLDGFRLGINTFNPMALAHLKIDGLAGNRALEIQSDHTLPDPNQYGDMVFTNDNVLTLPHSPANNREWVIRSIGNKHSSDSKQTLEIWAPNYDKPHVYFPNGYENASVKVGIGVAPGSSNWDMLGEYQLYVKTGILTEKLKVANCGTTNWADYVFDDDYELLSLEEVETFIDKNHHLPNVPSAQDVANDGIDVIEMDATLLRKIEELTLYVLELKKENDTIKEELKKLNKK